MTLELPSLEDWIFGKELQTFWSFQFANEITQSDQDVLFFNTGFPIIHPASCNSSATESSFALQNKFNSWKNEAERESTQFDKEALRFPTDALIQLNHEKCFWIHHLDEWLYLTEN